MDKIIFEYTKFGRYAAQGSSPSGKEGYNIWIQYPDDEMVAFLGFIDVDRLYGTVKYYEEQGDEVIYAREK